ncbi:CDP-glycerol glycerophosphotransferase family protein [Methanobrevibacter sp.]|uniref:CDP-glycerol glycerophosphotransferase family protein n=1 Tax=Methanobrevibacter sp. TaxID=66852 RepID=UPI0025FDD123|nr:CDP-glycerol glycerophosphotransferase family protein [Methanobrevibacter sp.]MBQ2962213.1 CDP-glycerol glycerophosphotransferase family protein [Methanobrevibacter sp.]
MSKFKLKIGDKTHGYRIIAPFQDIKKPQKRHFGFFRLRIDRSELSDYSKHNLVVLHGENDNSILFNGRSISYRRRTSCRLFDNENDRVAYFRESINGKLMFTVRERTGTDNVKSRLQIICAFILSKFMGLFTRKNLLFMYEKFGRYEEGASILFEYLIDHGYENAFLIANPDFLPKDLDEKYLANIIEMFTFRHYLYYFLSDTFVSSEQIVRAVDLDSQSFMLWKHCRKGYRKTTHIYLQHGINYMLNFNSPFRSNGRKVNKAPFYRQVHISSSKKEAQHFMEEGLYDEDEIYITGMPKLDKAIGNEDADKIVIMPTWRPWEINDAMESLENTTYFKFLQSIVDAVPEVLEDKIIILIHPLFNDVLNKRSEFEYGEPYDKILRDARLLITDYSSVSFDAFYRGSNVIFNWSEKESCMKKYGKGTCIKLTEDEAFGYVCYNQEELTEAIKKAYYEPQKQEWIDNYMTLNEFNDGRNCERVVEWMKKDGII